MTQRRKNLDGLRTIAVFLVLFNHASLGTGNGSWLYPLMQVSWNGVYLFLTLSGFLIGTVLLKEINQQGTFSITNYFGRRILRTWPVYFILLAFYFWRSNIGFKELIPYLTFTQNYLNRPIYVVTWSLAAQEQFYLLLPVLLLIMVKLGVIRTKLFYFFIVAGAILGFVGIYRHGDVVRFGSFAPMFLGVLIADLELNKNWILEKLKGNPHFLFALGLTFVYGSFMFFSDIDYRVLLFQVLGFACLVIACLSPQLWFGPVLNSRFMVGCAEISYSTYLFQDRPLFRVEQLANYLSLEGSIRFFFVLVLSIVGAFGCGWILFQIFERPFMNLRSRLFPSRI
jgi:peptidoglycan/LPS O-acetylase OafA/YrhL